MNFMRFICTTALLLFGSQAHSHPLEGSWQFVSGEYYTEQGDFSAKAPHISSTKVISDGYFNYITSKEGSFHYAAGGRYEISEQYFVEYIDYGNIPSLLGRRLEFTYNIDGNLWHHRLYEQGKLIEYEIWKRLK